MRVIIALANLINENLSAGEVDALHVCPQGRRGFCTSGQWATASQSLKIEVSASYTKYLKGRQQRKDVLILNTTRPKFWSWLSNSHQKLTNLDIFVQIKKVQTLIFENSLSSLKPLKCRQTKSSPRISNTQTANA